MEIKIKLNVQKKSFIENKTITIETVTVIETHRNKLN